MAWKKIQWSDDAAAVTVRKNSGSNIGTRPRLNFIEGSNITLAISDDAGSDEIDISIAASGGVTDHGALTGLTDYDHDQYLRRNGGNTVTGNLLPDATASYRDLGSAAQKWDDVYAQDVRADRIHMAGNLDMNDYLIDDVDDIQAYDIAGINCKNYLGASVLSIGYYDTSFTAFAECYMSTNKITALGAGTSATDAVRYDQVLRRAAADINSFAEKATPINADIVLIEDSAASYAKKKVQVGNLPGGVTDHGALTGLADDDHTQYLLLSGSRAMTGDLDIGNNDIVDVDDIRGASVNGTTTIFGGPSTSAAPTLSLCGKDHPATPGEIQMSVPDAAETSLINVIRITGCTDTPIVKVYRGLDMNDNTIKDLKNSAASALSGTQKDIEIDIGGTPYYFTVYPTKV